VDPIDRELASLLSVEPSPEFRARVRARLAGEPAPHSWFLQGRLAGIGVAALAIVTAVVVGRVDRPNKPPRSLPPAVRTSLLPSVPASPMVTPASRVATGSRPPRRREAEVLVAPSEVRGLRQLAAIVRQGRTQLMFPDEDTRAVSPDPVKDIVITPIAIAPLETAAVSEFAGNLEGDEQ
jgi:hypothetical protein